MSEGKADMRTIEGDDAWSDPWWERFLFDILPWVLLVSSVVAVLALPSQPLSDYAVTVGLSLSAGAWMLFGYTLRAPEQRRRPVPATVYFVGLLAVIVLLLVHNQLFLIFAIAGFLHAMLLPIPWAFVGVAAASVALYTPTMGLPGTADDMPFLQHLFLYTGVIAIQTFAIGSGLAMAQKGAAQLRERRRMVLRLERALEENAGLHAQLLTQVREAGMMDERQRMAREIHDTLAQGLTGIITQIQAAQRTWESPETARPHTDRALGLARESLAEARRSVQALRPGQLAGSHLPEALDEFTRTWSQGTDVRAGLEVIGEPVALSPAIEVALFRVTQEALANVAKHADASRVGVTLSYLDDVVLLDVRDDGRGMTGRGRDGFGLNSMRQRIRGIGGRVEVESEAGEGTAVSATVPAVVEDTT